MTGYDEITPDCFVSSKKYNNGVSVRIELPHIICSWGVRSNPLVQHAVA